MSKISAMEWYKALTETRTSLGLSKKVASTYKDKTADDVVKETFLTSDGFLAELKNYALAECKMSPKSIEVNVYSAWKEIYFYFGFGDHDLIVLFPSELDTYFGILTYSREDGKERVLTLEDLSERIETSSFNQWPPVDIFYEISPMNLEVMKKFVKRRFSIYGQRR